MTSDPILAAENQLRRSLSDESLLVMPAQRAYSRLRKLGNRRFNDHPYWIVQCRTESDVVATLLFARTLDVPLSVRAGGMSPGGYASNNGGVLLDLSGFDAISIDAGAKTVTVGAGVLLGTLYEALGKTGLMVTAGECLDVGVSGITLGGGFSLLSRSLGLACDNLLAATIVTADGEVLYCDDSASADLLWALRGAGGGNFGVVTWLTLRVHAVDTVAYARVLWPLDQAVDVLAQAIPMFGGDAPDGVDGFLSLEALPGPTRVLGAFAVYNGPPDRGAVLLKPLLALGTPLKASSGTDRYVNLMKAIPDPPMCTHDYYKSGFIAGAIPRSALQLIVDRFAAAPEKGDSIMNLIAFDFAGGAINRVAPMDTAFVHRRSAVLLAIIAAWTSAEFGGNPEEKQWADDLYAVLQPVFTGFVYQNYPDRALEDPLAAYYGENLPRLRLLKQKYDPDNVFRFPQGLTPSLEPAALRPQP